MLFFGEFCGEYSLLFFWHMLASLGSQKGEIGIFEGYNIISHEKEVRRERERECVL